MIELIREHDMTRIGPLKGLLESAGIKTFVRNEFLSATEATIPPFFPALCIVNDEDHERAVALIREHEQSTAEEVQKQVRCPQCGEESPGTFEVCWQCGTDLGKETAPGSN